MRHMISMPGSPVSPSGQLRTQATTYVSNSPSAQAPVDPASEGADPWPVTLPAALQDTDSWTVTLPARQDTEQYWPTWVARESKPMDHMTATQEVCQETNQHLDNLDEIPQAADTEQSWVTTLGPDRQETEQQWPDWNQTRLEIDADSWSIAAPCRQETDQQWPSWHDIERQPANSLGLAQSSLEKHLDGPYTSDDTLRQMSNPSAPSHHGPTDPLDNDALCGFISALQATAQPCEAQVAETAPSRLPSDTSHISPMELAAMREILAALANNDGQTSEEVPPSAPAVSDESTLRGLITYLQASYAPNCITPGAAQAGPNGDPDLNGGDASAASSSGKGKSTRGPRRKQESLIDLAAKQQGMDTRQSKVSQKQPPQVEQRQPRRQQQMPCHSVDSDVGGVQTNEDVPFRPPKFCPYCGANFRPTYKFCEFCGNRVVP
jgi:hypothetical protein